MILVNFKRFYSILLVLVVGFFCVICCGNVVNAYNIDDLYEYALQLQSQNVGTTEQRRAYTNLINNYNKFKNVTALKNCSSLYCYSPNSTFVCNIFYWNSPFKVEFNSAQTLVNSSQGGIYQLQYGNVNDNGYGWNFQYGSNVGFGLLDLSLNTQTEIDNMNWSNWYLNNKYDEPLGINFDLHNSGSISVFYNGSSSFFYKFPYSRTVKQWDLGSFDTLTDFNIDVRLNRFLNDTYSVTVAHGQWYNGNKSSSGLVINDDGIVFLDNLKVFYNQGYSLSIDVNGELFDSYPVYFVPYTYSSASGDLLSPDVDTNSDIELLNNIQDLVSLGNIDNTFELINGSYFGSGEALWLSGDPWTVSGNFWNDTGYHFLANPYSNWLYDYMNSLLHVLTDNRNEVISFSIHGRNYTFNSSDFSVPDGGFKNFISLVLVSFTFFSIFKQLYGMVHSAASLDVSKMLLAIDFDWSNFL